MSFGTFAKTLLVLSKKPGIIKVVDSPTFKLYISDLNYFFAPDLVNVPCCLLL